MPDLTKGKRFCRVSQTWLEPAEYAQRYALYDELAFQRAPSQGQLATPMIIQDGQRPLQSMTNGKIYDSKSEMRKEYKRAGATEVGDQALTKREKPSRAELDRRKTERRASCARALSQMGFGAP